MLQYAKSSCCSWKGKLRPHRLSHGYLYQAALPHVLDDVDPILVADIRSKPRAVLGMQEMSGFTAVTLFKSCTNRLNNTSC